MDYGRLDKAQKLHTHIPRPASNSLCRAPERLHSETRARRPRKGSWEMRHRSGCGAGLAFWQTQRDTTAGPLISGDFSSHGNGDGWGGAYGCDGLDATGHTASDERDGRRHWCVLGGHRPRCITEAFDTIPNFVQLDGLYPMTSSISRL